MVSAGPYILGVLGLAALVLSLGFSAIRLRQRLLPDWESAPAHLVDAIVAIALVIWLSEALGLFGLLYAWALVASSLLLAGAIAAATGWKGRRGCLGRARRPVFRPAHSAREVDSKAKNPACGGGTPVSPSASSLIAIAVVALVFAHWGLTAADALSRGMFNFDSLWYHMPFATEFVQSHSVTGLHYPETVFTNWFYPQNSELLHAVGILLTERDTLSLFLNFGWLAIAFLAAWCIGRPYGRGYLSVVAVAIVLSSHTLVVREPGAAKNDVMAAALLLASIAILINAWAARQEGRSLPVGWPLAAAGLATGLAVGTKSTALAMAVALTASVVVLAPTGKRGAAAGWWLLPALAGGGFWYLRNLIAAGNPLPQIESLGPISLPHPERMQSGRPDFSIAHYATDTGVWREYFGPGFDHAFGSLWPLVVCAALAGAVLAVAWPADRAVRWIGAVVLVGVLAYLFTPLSAAGAEGEPVGFAINIRYAIPALLAGLALLPLALPCAKHAPASDVPDVPPESGPYGPLSGGTSARGAVLRWGAVAALLAVLALTDRSDAVLRDPDRLFGWALALLLVLVPAALLFARRRGVSRGAIAAGFAALALAVAAIGYPLQRDYLGDRFANADPDTSVPGMSLDSAYRWAREVEDARIGLAGTTAGFLGYGFYGTDLSNRVSYVGAEGPHGAFNAIPDCRSFRSAVSAAGFDYLVTAPFLNFIHPDDPVTSPEAGWLRGEAAVAPVLRSGPVTVWRLRGPLDPRACGRLNAPLRYVPQQPG